MNSSVLARLPLLQGLAPSTIAAVKRALTPVSVPADTVLFQTGDYGDACFIIETGKLDVTNFLGGSVLASLSSGEFVGELALLLSQPRTATVVAETDCQLQQLKRSDLDTLIADHPDLALAITRELGRRIVQSNTRFAGHMGGQRCVVWPASMVAPLAATIRARGHRVAIRKNAKRLSDRTLTSVLIAAPNEPSPATLKTIGEVDHVLAFGDSPPWLREATRPNRFVRLDATPLGMRRATRWATGRAVGIVLSSGGSKTVAHIGVLRVLRDAGIEFDAVAGTSGGALAAVGVGFERDEEFLRNCLRDIQRATKWRRLDFNFPPRSGLSKGRRLRDMFAKWTLSENLEDGHIPIWLVGADVATGEAVVMHTGNLADAVRGSLSVPGAFNPWRVGAHLLIDGAVANPLPTDVLRAAGVGVVLASSVAGQASAIEIGKRLPGLGQIMGRVLNTMERERINNLIPLADVVIRPIVTAANTFDFSNVESSIAAGATAAEECLPEIRKLLRAASDLTSLA